MRGAVFTDLDGTLLNSDSTISDTNDATLRLLGNQGHLRVILTGRSLYSARRVVTNTTPIDFLVVSSGSAILNWPSGEVLYSQQLSAAEAEYGIAQLLSLGLDFMVHDPWPHSHAFTYVLNGAPNPDFKRRTQRYLEFARVLDVNVQTYQPATQFLVVARPSDNILALHEVLLARFSDFSVVRATSPLDKISTWFEIFPSGVSKGNAAAWLGNRAGIGKEQCAAIGNDYNDISLLEWCPNAFVVDNAPTELKQRFRVVGSNDEHGVAEAIHYWLGDMFPSE
jgi:Cof subfamily protein (haloacid dehalogenase superfamily)